MSKRPYFRMGVGLIVVGAALLALNIWLLITFHWVLPGSPRGRGAFGVLGATKDHSRGNGCYWAVRPPDTSSMILSIKFHDKPL